MIPIYLMPHNEENKFLNQHHLPGAENDLFEDEKESLDSSYREDELKNADEILKRITQI